MTKSTLFHYWPVHIGEFYNSEHSNIKKDLINFFKDYEKKNPEGNKQLSDKNYTGNHNLYQSNYDLHNEGNEAYATLLNDYISEVLPSYCLWMAVPFLRYKIENGNIFAKTSETGTFFSVKHFSGYVGLFSRIFETT